MTRKESHEPLWHDLDPSERMSYPRANVYVMGLKYVTLELLQFISEYSLQKKKERTMTSPQNQTAFLRALSGWQPTPDHLPLLLPLTPEERRQVHAAYFTQFRFRPSGGEDAHPRTATAPSAPEEGRLITQGTSSRS
jgi:hypothetical protein